MIRQLRIDKMKQILEDQGYRVEKEEEEDGLS